MEVQHLPVRIFQGQPGHQVDLRAHHDGCARFRLPDIFHDEIRGAAGVGQGHHLLSALRVHHHFGPGELLPPGEHVLHREAGVDVAVAVPEDQPGPADVVGAVAAQGLLRVPDDQVFRPQPQ